MEKASTFAKRLKEALQTSGITPTQLSRLSGVNRGNLYHYMNGDWEAKQDGVLALARVLNVSEAWLMGFDVPRDRDRSSMKETTIDERLALFDKLPPDKQNQVIEYMQFLIAASKKE